MSNKEIIQTEDYSSLLSHQCKYCQGGPIYSSDSDELEKEYLYLHIKNDNLNLFYENADPYESLYKKFEINYCPMCGRKLRKN